MCVAQVCLSSVRLSDNLPQELDQRHLQPHDLRPGNPSGDLCRDKCVCQVKNRRIPPCRRSSHYSKLPEILYDPPFQPPTPRPSLLLDPPGPSIPEFGTTIKVAKKPTIRDNQGNSTKRR